MGKDKILSLCMIVKDEESNLGPCLDTVGEVVDEIVVVDTGSRDRTKEIAQRHGARVYDFPWGDDFAAARNESIRHARGRYILWLDADDRISPGERDKLQRLKKDLKVGLKRAYLLHVRSHRPQGQDTVFLQVRLFPNIKGACFEGRVHEQISHVLERLGVRIAATDIVIDHLGYEDEEERREKARRNLLMILDELEKDPYNSHYNYHAANTYAALEMYEKAVFHMERVLESSDLCQDPGGLVPQIRARVAQYYIRMGRSDKGEKMLWALIKDYPQDGLAKFLLGELYHLAGRRVEALGLLREVLKDGIDVGPLPVPLDEINFKVRYYLGECLEDLGQEEEAYKYYLESLTFNGPKEKSLVRLGFIDLQRGESSRAVEFYKKAMELGDDRPSTLLNLGVALKRIGRLEEAQGLYESVLEREPSNLDAMVNLAHLALRRGELERAEGLFKRVLESPGEWLDVRLGLVEIYWKKGDVDALVDICNGILSRIHLSLNRTLESVKDLAEVFVDIGDGLKLRKHEAETIMAYRIGLIINPQNPTLTERLARYHHSRGEYKLALNYLQNLLRLRGESTETLNLMAECYSYLNVPKAAELCARRARELGLTS